MELIKDVLMFFDSSQLEQSTVAEMKQKVA